MRDLDKAIEMSDVYKSNFEARMDGARERLAATESDSLKWECAYELFSGYSLVNSDSTLLYLSMMAEHSYDNPDLQLLTKVCRSEMYSLTGDKDRFNNSIPILLGNDIPASIESRYFSIIIDSYSNFPFQDNNKDIELLDRAIRVNSLPENLILYYNGLREKAYNDNQAALDYLSRAYDGSQAPYLKACISESIASIYEDWSEKDLEKIWLSRAAAWHIQTPAVLPASLYKLSMILFESGDLERASKYTRFALGNAIDSKYNDTVINSVKAQLAIMDSIEANRRSRMNTLFFAMAILLLTSIVISVFWHRSIQDRKSLIQSQEDLKLSNLRLEEADKVKNGVMFRYMLQSVNFLSESDTQRRRYHKVLKEEGEEALKKVLRDPTQTEASHKEFYKTFDKAFLDIYPDFISRVNTLFPADMQFKESDNLGTQLRILAVIKLGLTDSGQIARFLNCSPSSVYTHRSRMKHFALCDGELFESKIQSI
ncbi:MAG: hypothetical protein IJM35_10385 [Bacteroidales bacterium]|nr:hypothetical protein [Bacteroidales bacterium]